MTRRASSATSRISLGFSSLMMMCLSCNAWHQMPKCVHCWLYFTSSTIVAECWRERQFYPAAELCTLWFGRWMASLKYYLYLFIQFIQTYFYIFLFIIFYHLFVVLFHCQLHPPCLWREDLWHPKRAEEYATAIQEASRCWCLWLPGFRGDTPGVTDRNRNNHGDNQDETTSSDNMWVWINTY